MTLPNLGQWHTPPMSPCPYLKHLAADWLWSVEGFCCARADARLMVPPVPHYFHRCATGDYRACDAFRARTPTPGDYVMG